MGGTGSDNGDLELVNKGDLELILSHDYHNGFQAYHTHFSLENFGVLKKYSQWNSYRDRLTHLVRLLFQLKPQ